jgi:hypothetical protein
MRECYCERRRLLICQESPDISGILLIFFGCLIYISTNIIGSSETVTTLVIYIPEVFFADRKLHADFGTMAIYPASRVRGFPNKHRAPEYEFTASSTLQTFTFPQFKLFLYPPAKQVDVNMPFNFVCYSFNIHG